MDKIQLQKNNILKFEIVTSDGESTGNYITFDLEDIELPLKINQCEEMHRKNLMFLQEKMIILEKQEDKKGRFLLSWKDEEKIRIFREFYKKEQEALDLFLGKGGTEKLLNGRNPYYTMYEDISASLEPILPQIKVNVEGIKNKIKNKYNIENEDVLK